MTVHDPGAAHRVSGKRDADGVLLGMQANEKGSSLASDMADLSFEGSAAAHHAALTPSGLTRETSAGRPLSSPEVMMSRPQHNRSFS